MPHRNKMLKVLSTTTMLLALTAASPAFSHITYAANGIHDVENKKKEDKEKKNKEDKEKKEREKKAREERMKEVIKGIVKAEGNKEDERRLEDTQELLKKLPPEALEMYEKAGGKIHLTEKSIAENPLVEKISEKDKNIKDSEGNEVSLDSHVVFSIGGKEPALIIHTEEFSDSHTKSKEVYYEFGKAIARDTFEEKTFVNEAFIDALDRVQADEDASALLLSHLPTHEGKFDSEYVKEHIDGFREVFAQAFSYYYEPTYQPVLKTYAPEMFKYMDEMNKNGFEEINKSVDAPEKQPERKDFEENVTAADTWYKEMYKDYSQKLKPEQKSAIQLYTTQNYKTINKGLRENDLPLDKIKEVRDMSKALAKSPLSEAGTVYRKVGKDALGIDITTNFKNENVVEKLKNQLEGSIREEKAFLSTSVANHFSESFDAKTVLVKINIPEGTHAAYIFGDLATYQGESELIIDKGSSYRIDKIDTYEYTKKSGVKQTNLLVEATLLPSHLAENVNTAARELDRQGLKEDMIEKLIDLDESLSDLDRLLKKSDKMDKEEVVEFFNTIVGNLSHVTKQDAAILDSLVTSSRSQEKEEYQTWLEDVKTMYNHYETMQQLNDNEIVEYVTDLKSKLDSITN
ncbi:lethal factor domain protein [Brevibacillus laterosporus]|uniref:Lethal factor domain protein n=2 Tax=Brevibacillus laterosporus TaxID=1465 RepID=A0A075R783_BRELA|nr:ADP-ribosyltransferase [Brevibacillus laterosporus]AIG27266.1 lethal factor domain protein [Brevibacillus laterosporus LMG 15441]RJL11536.1 lethal factor domain protein [Brevibacillus laterosporus]TPH09354.1 lethal factor domain protein [Brevibacillus laterosporus]